jgi:hypothetical protein
MERNVCSVKVRRGFVSNSSSSSFLVAFPKRIDEMTVDELQKLLFANLKELEGYEDSYPTSQIAETVYGNALSKEPFTNYYEQEQEMVEIVESGWYPGKPEFPMEIYKLENEDRYVMIKAARMIDHETAKVRLRRFVMDSFMALETQPLYYVFEYSDNDGAYYSTLEHSGIFDRLPNMVISHH